MISCRMYFALSSVAMEAPPFARPVAGRASFFRLSRTKHQEEPVLPPPGPRDAARRPYRVLLGREHEVLEQRALRPPPPDDLRVLAAVAVHHEAHGGDE